MQVLVIEFSIQVLGKIYFIFVYHLASHRVFACVLSKSMLLTFFFLVLNINVCICKRTVVATTSPTLQTLDLRLKQEFRIQNA